MSTQPSGDPSEFPPFSSCAWYHSDRAWASVSKSPCFCSFERVARVDVASLTSCLCNDLALLSWLGKSTHCPFDPFPCFPEGFHITAVPGAFSTPRRQSLASLGPALTQAAATISTTLSPGEVCLRLRSLMPASHIRKPQHCQFQEREKMYCKIRGPLSSWLSASGGLV